MFKQKKKKEHHKREQYLQIFVKLQQAGFKLDKSKECCCFLLT